MMCRTRTVVEQGTGLSFWSFNGILIEKVVGEDGLTKDAPIYWTVKSG
jgi:hypothetical protein